MTSDRPRRVEVRPFPSNRRLVTAALRAGKHAMTLHGLLDVDVIHAKRLLATHEPAPSFSAFVIASVGRAAAAHPQVHAYRSWRRRLVVHRHVDITTIVEIATAQGPFPLAHAIRDADIRDVADVMTELHRVKTLPSMGAGRRWIARVMPVASRVPDFPVI